MIERYAGHQPVIHEGAWVHETAVLIGEVELCEGASVWPTAVLRGDMGAVVIGRDSNIQDGSVCHDTTGISETIVGERVTVEIRPVHRVDDELVSAFAALAVSPPRTAARSASTRRRAR